MMLVIIYLALYTATMVGIGLWIGLELMRTKIPKPRKRSIHFAYQTESGGWELFSIEVGANSAKIFLSNITKMWRPRIWGRALTKMEWKEIWEAESRMLGIQIPNNKRLPCIIDYDFGKEKVIRNVST
jgi:hypothetical protein